MNEIAGGGRGRWAVSAEVGTGWRRAGIAIAAVVAGFVVVAEPRVAEACGCLSPPAVTEGEFAVNQRAEQIIFEVEPGWVTAHVLIKYAGNPAQFAWLVPVPEIPELAISPVSAFGLLDRATAPDLAVIPEDLCPISEWSCSYHQQPVCGGNDNGVYLVDGGGGFADAGAGGMPPVTVLDQQVVGDYQTVTFRASEAAAATQWLRDNGFIVNPTTSIYMEPYVQANMVFVAAKLVAGAGIDAIKPLRMRYRAPYPMIPLVLTAVAAEPHLTVTAFVYGDEPYRPMGHPMVEIDPKRLATDASGRLNYPMVLARTIDEAGGHGFAVEYRGGSVPPSFTDPSGCCGNGYDRCFLGFNSQCECPRDEFDRNDCEAVGDVVDGVALLDELALRHTTLTRLTTRVSAEEMTFDPQFEIDYGAAPFGRMSVRTTQPTLDACASAVIDKPRHAELEALQACASVYCGAGGECVTTARGAACACGPGTVAQRFLDLDGAPSITCVPEVPPVDLRAGGEQLPDACVGVSCGAGACIDRNGTAVCACAAGAAAVPGASSPRCEPIERSSHTIGALDFSEGLRKLDVCAPPPPSCYAGGWLERTGSTRPGVVCGDVTPAAHLTRPGPKPQCDGLFGCGGCQHSSAPVGGVVGGWPIGGVVGGWIVALLVLRRRRRPGAR